MSFKKVHHFLSFQDLLRCNGKE
uniref:Uncharacterized protein n=1 Tax=Anguilla anguilla TaxID=7936 RepID=A0A0E9QPS2_ANGAN